MEAIRKNFSKGKIRNILGHEADPRFFSSYSQKYSLAVEEGNYSTTQKQMELQQLLNFREMQIPVTNKSILRAAFLTNKRQVIDEMEQEQQQQQQAQEAQSQQQAQLDQAKIMQAFAKSRLDMAKVDESQAKVVDLHADAEHKRTQTEMDLVKSMLDLENMDLEMIGRSYEIAMAIKGQNTENTNQTANMG